MADSIAFPARAEPRAISLSTIPWYLWVSVIGVTSAMIGVHWDISWHRSIGRDTFWTPPHIAIYLCGVIAGISSAYLILATTFGRLPAVRASSVRMWGFHGPLGAFVTAWGGIAMLVSAPFDDWWHNAYGLDVKILSPPHTLLAMGMIFLQFGACVSICKYLNTGIGNAAVLRLLFVIGACSLLCMVYTLFTDFLHVRAERSGSFYIIAAIASLLLLPAFGRALRMRWGMTAITGGYFLLVALSNWILQLFPAEPKLGPILTHLTHFQPAQFPALVFIPALAMDLVLQRSRANDWVKAFWLSLFFVVGLAAVQYPLSGFLLESPGARNWFFGADTWYYGASPDAPFRYSFRPEDIASLPKLLGGLAIAVAAGWLCAGVSLRWGRWMLKIQR